MRPIQRYRVRSVIAATLIGFGTSKLLAQAFLATWQILSADQSDIAARGVWFLAMFRPELAIATVAITVLVFVALTRRTRRPLVARLVLGAVSAALGVLFVFRGADPTAVALNLIQWPSPLAYYGVSAAVAVVIVLMGLVATIRLARDLQVEPAAA